MDNFHGKSVCHYSQTFTSITPQYFNQSGKLKYKRFLKTIYPIYIPLLASVERTKGKAVVALIISWQKTPEERIESGKA